jgi:hypothetical protein
MSKRFCYLLASFAFVGGFLVSDLGRNYLLAQEDKKPKWSHGLMLRVRKADEPDFNKDTKKVGVEVFTDENNGNLIYISETGDIAVVKK